MPKLLALAAAVLGALIVQGQAVAATGTDHIVLRYRGSADQARALAHAEHLSHVRLIPQLHTLAATAPATTVTSLEQQPQVVNVQQDVTVHTLGDPIDTVLPWPAQQLDYADAWQITPGSHNIVVAVVDTGVNNSQDLQGVLLPGMDFVDNDTDPSDPNGHGTAVATTIAAIGGNNFGTTGGCQCSILPVRALGANGSGTDSTLAEAVTWAADHGANIINISLGGSQQDQVLADAINYALGKGVIIVAAAGNNANTDPFYPAADAGVVSVAATDQTGALASYSDHGADWVAVAAPGCTETQVTAPDGQTGVFYFISECGTSFAAPQVAALAGLALSWQPTLPAAQVIAAIEQSAVASPALDVKYGLVNAFAMFKQLGAVTPPTQTVAPQLTGSPVAGKQVSANAGGFTTIGTPTTTTIIQRCSRDLISCRTVSGSTTYLVSRNDIGYRLRAVTTISDLSGTATFVSAPTAAVTAPKQKPSRSKLSARTAHHRSKARPKAKKRR